RGNQHRDPVGEEDRPRLPQPGALQDRHLLSLWRTRSLPTRKPVEPFYLAEAGEETNRLSEYLCRHVSRPSGFPERAVPAAEPESRPPVMTRTRESDALSLRSAGGSIPPAVRAPTNLPARGNRG